MIGVAESYESLGKKGKDKDVKTVLQPNAMPDLPYHAFPRDV